MRLTGFLSVVRGAATRMRDISHMGQSSDGSAAPPRERGNADPRGAPAEWVSGKVLFLAANPASAPHLALDEEVRAIDQKIRMSDGRDRLQLVAGWAVRADDLLQLLNQHRPAIVHFSGHGTPGGALMLVDDRGEATLFPVQALDALSLAMQSHVKLVFLNACDSLEQAKVISRHIDFVIGMSAAVSDGAAIVFAAAFYRALGFGRGVRESCAQARTALMLAGYAEDHTPVLLVREPAPGAERFT